tara:strand:+ start:1233 stop:2540 length:1308 start_codon:yes stop_codon:yes gene_type:complete
MEKSIYKNQSKKKVYLATTFTVPVQTREVQENLILTTHIASKPSKEQIIKQAFDSHSKGNIQEAAKHYQHFIDQGFNDHRVFTNYGVILKNLGKLQEAEISYRKAIELHSDFAMGHSNLGNILSDLGKLEEAEISHRKAIELKPDVADFHYNLANILRALGNLEQAEISLKKAIELKFGFVQAHDALANIQDKLGRRKESEDSAKQILYLKSKHDSNFNSKKINKNNLFQQPSPIEHEIFYRPGMGTENIGPFLRSMVMMLRPKRVIEIGAGYTTPFLLEGIINNQRVFDDGNLNESYFQKYTYDSKLIVIDNKSQGDLKKIDGMKEIMESEYTDFVEGNFEGKAERLFKKYGHFDFVWLDCGSQREYTNFFKEFWQYCSHYIFFHFTYLKGLPNIKHKVIQENLRSNSFMFDIVEPHKKFQGSLTMVKRENFQA